MTNESRITVELLTIEELSAILKVSVRTTRRLHDQGKLPRAIRIGALLRWRRSDVEEFLRGGRK